MKSIKLLFKTGFVIIVGTITVCSYSCGGNEDKNKSSADSLIKSIEDKYTPSETSANTSSLHAKGEEVYKQTCQACHQANGEGLPSAFPPLAKSDYLLADKTRAIKQIINGSSGEITVNSKKFNGTMPPQSLTDEQIADVLNYTLNSWGNNGGVVTVEEVKLQRGN